jgi:hypothetical protein
MLLTALPPAPPTPTTVMRGLSSLGWIPSVMALVVTSDPCEFREAG